MLATRHHAPKDDKHLNVLQQLLRVLAVAGIGLTAASWYHRRPRVRQRVAIRTIGV
jgi:hypothetical protein